MGAMETPPISTELYVDGAFVRGDGPALEVRNPATDELLATIPTAGRDLAARAAAANGRAAVVMRTLPAARRAELARRLGAALRAESSSLAMLLTLEAGKPIAESRTEVEYAASFFDVAASVAEMAEGDLPAARAPDRRILVLREPVGATVAIVPWNFPLAMVARKLAPALAAGCSQLVKPAEATPLTALALARIFAEVAASCGAPPAAFGVVVGDAPTIADAMLAEPSTRKLSFTGSTEVGRILAAKCGGRLVRSALELGGNAPFLVFADADLDRAADQAILSKFRFMGQTCISANRFLIERPVLEPFLDRLEARIAALPIGDPRLEPTRIGPLIDDDAVGKVERHLADALAKGARIRRGGRRARIEGLADRFLEPTILEGCTPDMAVSREETFGPVAAVAAFDREHEAIALANGVPSGLAGYVMTQDADRLLRIAEALDCGVVGANDGAPSAAEAPFGGRKDSGLGREGGRHGLDAYVDLKYVSLRLRGG